MIPLIEPALGLYRLHRREPVSHSISARLSMHRGTRNRRHRLPGGVVRIYDVSSTTTCVVDRLVFRRSSRAYSARCRARSSTSFREYLHERERCWHWEKVAAGPAYESGVPLQSSPAIVDGMNIAALTLDGNRCVIDPNADVNETASIVLGAKRSGGRSAIVILGGGSPKNFALQTEPQIQEVLGIDEKGHDYFLQITDARPIRRLSGATQRVCYLCEIDPDRLPRRCVLPVCNVALRCSRLRTREASRGSCDGSTISARVEKSEARYAKSKVLVMWLAANAVTQVYAIARNGNTTPESR